jgi:hypothetical protein
MYSHELLEIILKLGHILMYFTYMYLIRDVLLYRQMINICHRASAVLVRILEGVI